MPRLIKVTCALAWRQQLEDHAIALEWSEDGRALAAAAVSGPITLFEGGGAVARVLPGHGLGTTSLCFVHGGRLLASAGQDGLARLWELASGEARAALPGGAAWVERVAACPGQPLVATAAGRTLRLWDDEGRLVRDYPQHPATIADITWRPGRPVLASATYGFLSLWSPERERPLQQFAWKGSMLRVAWSPSGKYIATGNQDATVHFWILESEEDLQMCGYPHKIRELSWDPTGRYLATGGSAAVTVWDVAGKGPAGTRPAELEAHEGRVSALAFQGSGPLLASGGTEGDVALWAMEGRKGHLLGRQPLGAEVTELRWAPDDQHLAAATARGDVAVFAVGLEARG